mmetsp:Transcript_33877/g.37860  ORF Transcript_33877/g.37860 Transcript_33877/m.37860 type:complete len:83 (+) Transcript_33877:1578-1826(+)
MKGFGNEEQLWRPMAGGGKRPPGFLQERLQKLQIYLGLMAWLLLRVFRTLCSTRSLSLLQGKTANSHINDEQIHIKAILMLM